MNTNDPNDAQAAFRPQPPDDKPPPDPGPPPPPAKPPRALELLKIHNQERLQRGLRPFSWNDKLARAAQGHADWMAAHRRITHANNGSFTDRLRAEGYRIAGAGENIAAGQHTPAEAVNAWMNSPGHRQNVLGDFADAGFGAAQDSSGRGYWCADFGSERSAQAETDGPTHEPGPCEGR